MYKKLPKILYLHPHTKGWSIPGYSHDDILDTSVHGEPNNTASVVIKELVTTDLPELLLALMVGEGRILENIKLLYLTLLTTINMMLFITSMSY